MIELIERVAKLETRVDLMESTQGDILEELRKVNQHITRYHGFAGGIAFVLSGMVVAWQLFGEWIKSHFAK